jgi:hypothetical protein
VCSDQIGDTLVGIGTVENNYLIVAVLGLLGLVHTYYRFLCDRPIGQDGFFSW